MKRTSKSYIMTVDYKDAGGMLTIETLRDSIKAVNSLAAQQDRWAKYRQEVVKPAPRYYVKLQGRGPRTNNALSAGRRPRAFDQSLPLKFAERVDVYVYKR